ncbi:MAG: hypothetical protein ACI9F2_000035 [Lysobacterales bacterium]|jgi:hypothetical protein
MKNLVSIILGLCCLLSVTPVTAGVIDYTLWEKVLSTHVDDQGRVNYKGLKKSPTELDQFIEILIATDINVLSPTQQKAFWINAYNALTLMVVRDNYPTKSIRKINFRLVWELPRKVALGKYSLGKIEHKILRPLKDPRIHFAINCASIGCPNLPNKPFYPETLDEQLDFETKRFINDHEKLRIDRTAKVLYHSAILKWFHKDFLVKYPHLLGYIMAYINESDRSYLEKNEVKIEVLDYNWGINKQ